MHGWDYRIVQIGVHEIDRVHLLAVDGWQPLNSESGKIGSNQRTIFIVLKRPSTYVSRKQSSKLARMNWEADKI